MSKSKKMPFIIRILKSKMVQSFLIWAAPKVWNFIKRRYASRKSAGNGRVYKDNLNG